MGQNVHAVLLLARGRRLLTAQAASRSISCCSGGTIGLLYHQPRAQGVGEAPALGEAQPHSPTAPCPSPSPTACAELTLWYSSRNFWNSISDTLKCSDLSPPLRAQGEKLQSLLHLLLPAKGHLQAIRQQGRTDRASSKGWERV